jgi:hypothetical protein
MVSSVRCDYRRCQAEIPLIASCADFRGRLCPFQTHGFKFSTEDIGNTFGPKGFARGSSLQVSSSKYPRYIPSSSRANPIVVPTAGPANTWLRLTLAENLEKPHPADLRNWSLHRRNKIKMSPK